MSVHESRRHARLATNLVAFCVLTFVGCSRTTESSPTLRGLSVLQNGEPRQAIQQFDELIEADSEAPKAFYYRGMAYQEIGDLDRAVEDYKTAIEVNRKLRSNVSQADLDANRARVPLYRSERARILSQLGVIHNKKQQFDQAIDVFTDAIRADPTDAKAYCGRGIAFLARGIWDVAVDDLTEAIERDGELGEALYHRARAHIVTGNLRQAVEDARLAIRKDPKSALAYKTLGSAYLAQGEPSKAKNCFREAIRLDESLTTVIERQLQSAESAIAAALSEAEAATGMHRVLKPTDRGGLEVESRPSSAEIEASSEAEDAHISTGLLHLKKENFLLAIAAFTKALKINETSSQAHYGRGVAFLERGFPDTAIEDLTEAINMDKNHVDAYCTRARAATMMGRYDSAIRDSTQAILLEPGNADAYLQRSLAYIELDELDRAVTDLREAKRLDPRRSEEIGSVIQSALALE